MREEGKTSFKDSIDEKRYIQVTYIMGQGQLVLCIAQQGAATSVLDFDFPLFMKSFLWTGTCVTHRHI